MADVQTKITYTFRVSSQEYGLILKTLKSGNPRARELAEELEANRERFRKEMLRKFSVETQQQDVDP